MTKILGSLALVVSIVSLFVSGAIYNSLPDTSENFGATVLSQDLKVNRGLEVYSTVGTSTIKARSSNGNTTCLEFSYATSATTSQVATLLFRATSTQLVTGTTTLASGVVGYVMFSTSSCATI